MSPLAIINPTSGGGGCGRKAPRVLDALARGGRSPDVAATDKPGAAAQIAARAYADGRRAFLSMGGDGTLFEIVNGLIPAALGDLRTAIAVAPLGTGNSLVRDLPSVAVSDAATDEAFALARPTDLLRVTCREKTFYCANMISFGFAAAVGRVVTDYLKPLGPAAYLVGVLWRVAWLSPHMLPCRWADGAMRRERLTLLSVANSRYTGVGMLMAPAARIDDGLMDLIVGGVVGRLELLRLFRGVFDGSHVLHRAVRQETTAALEFDVAGPIGMIADGEYLEATPLRIDVVPRAIRMLGVQIAV